MARLEGADISIQDFVEESKGLSRSNLQCAFDKTSVLLTGVTSFIGSVVLEKLLRLVSYKNWCLYCKHIFNILMQKLLKFLFLLLLVFSYT